MGDNGGQPLGLLLMVLREPIAPPPPPHHHHHHPPCVGLAPVGPPSLPCPNKGLSNHGDPVFPHFYPLNQHLARVRTRAGGYCRMDPQCLDHHNPPPWRNRNGGVKTAAWRTFRRTSTLHHAVKKERVTVQGPGKKPQMDYMSHRGVGLTGGPTEAGEG